MGFGRVYVQVRAAYPSSMTPVPEVDHCPSGEDNDRRTAPDLPGIVDVTRDFRFRQW